MDARREAGVGFRSALAVALLVTPAAAQVITRVSVDSSGAQSDSDNFDPAISGDGFVVAFASSSTNLVSGDANGKDDVFVHDRSSGVTERVSVNTKGFGGNDDSDRPAISRDGSLVAFDSLATNLVSFSFAGVRNVYVRDRTKGVTYPVSVSASGGALGNQDSVDPCISADGTIVAFTTYMGWWSNQDKNGVPDIYLNDNTTGITELVSLSTKGASGDSYSFQSAISADGSLVVFVSYATNFAVSDTNGKADIFLRDRVAKTTRRLSTSTSGAEADADCTSPAISSDGSIVAYCSAATTLVAGDKNGRIDVFIRDRNAGTTERVSVDSSGAEGNGDSTEPALSSDGRYVSFTSKSSNFDPLDLDSKADVFIHDRVTGTTKLLTYNLALIPADHESYSSAISDDGGVVAFDSSASNLVLGDTNFFEDVFADDLTDPPVQASWSNYGSGYPGTLGVPTLTASADPVFGTTISIDASNSSGIWSEGFVPFGLSSTDIPTSAGGHLLVAPLSLLFLPLLPGGGSMITSIPKDLNLYGLSLYLQVIEIDPGAQHGLSFTPGLQLTFGQ